MPQGSVPGVRGTAAIPALPVGDITRACAFYRDVLGFEPVGAAGPDAAYVRGHGVTLLLRAAAAAGPQVGDSPDPGAPDTVILVDQPGRLRRLLDERSADLRGLDDLGPEWAGFFAVSDGYGNALGIGPTRRLGDPARRCAADALDDARIRLHERRRARTERVHVQEFRRFYERLPSTQNIFYMFFSEGLLHWVAKALSYVPRHVNLVLLGSALPQAEQEWITRHAGRPFHNIRLRIDDPTAWEFLFAVNRENFGWLDSDCLVLNGKLFDELSDIVPGTSANCAWSWDSGHGFPLANTFFLFMNMAAIRALGERDLAVSPSCYYYEWASLGVPGRRCYGRRPSQAQLRSLSSILPEASPGRPATPYGMPYYDTTVMYQLLARASGYEVRRVRELEGFGHIRGRPVQDESSDELLHVGGVSKADALDDFSRYFHSRQIRLLYLAAEYVMLAGIGSQLPPYYESRLSRAVAALADAGLTPAATEDMVRQHLSEVRGMSDSAVDAVLRRQGSDA
jgi:catechol 2,3-dioxygenase-like lactoylglutathione lyase family enzyme